MASVAFVPLATGHDAGAAPPAAFAQSYADTPGDGATCVCADVTAVTVANDSAGLLTFTVALANRPALQPGEVVVIGLDTDSTPATGGASGADRLLVLQADGHVELRRWTPAGYEARAARSLTAGFVDGVGTITVAAGDLAAPPVFRFRVATRGPTVTEDGAPDDGDAWRYVIGGTRPPLAPRIVKLVSGPPRLLTPGDLTIVAAVARTDTNGPVDHGRTRCTALAAGKRIPTLWVGPTRRGFASCTWVLPRDIAGKAVHATIAVTAFGHTVSRTIVRRVRHR
jgi:hypothetical protein